MAESSAGDSAVGKIQKTRRERVAKMYGQQKRNIIHMSSTAYEQDHSAAAPPRSMMTSRRRFIFETGYRRGPYFIPLGERMRGSSLAIVLIGNSVALGNHSRRQLFANAVIAASRVAA
jgi:hypothetical protein